MTSGRGLVQAEGASSPDGRAIEEDEETAREDREDAKENRTLVRPDIPFISPVHVKHCCKNLTCLVLHNKFTFLSHARDIKHTATALI